MKIALKFHCGDKAGQRNAWQTLSSTYWEDEWKLSSIAIHSGPGGDGNLAIVSICFKYFSVMVVWVLLFTPRAGSWVLCAALRSTSTSMGSSAVWKASTAWSWVAMERLLPFTYTKSLNEKRWDVEHIFQNLGRSCKKSTLAFTSNSIYWNPISDTETSFEGQFVSIYVK